VPETPRLSEQHYDWFGAFFDFDVLMSPKLDFGNTSFERVVRGDMFGRRVAKSEKLRHVKASCLH
jgi:hypothetical protein